MTDHVEYVPTRREIELVEENRELLRENLALAAMAGEIKAQLDCVRETSVTARETITACRNAVAYQPGRAAEALTTVRRILGVNF